ncbi:MAG: altronate dehydratase [Clostridiales bacterium]|nr:altronate dehydratase [Clostridiales bacterium]
MDYLKIHKDDNVHVALRDGLAVPAGHKQAICDIRKGENVIKYGFPIGHAIKDIKMGEHVHTHNVKTNLSDILKYEYTPNYRELIKREPDTFMGYVRKDSSVGVRNEVWVINTVFCVNGVAQKLCDMAKKELLHKYPNVEGVHTFAHPYGCSQMGQDQLNTQLSLKGLVEHPNAGAVLVLGLGCENNRIDVFKEILGSWDEDRVKFLEAQSVEDEYEAGLELLDQLMAYANGFTRERVFADKLKIGLKCGGSDGFSGITGNPLAGKACDILVSQGGTAVLTEVPEMFGAERMLMDRCVSREVFDKTVKLINDFKQYFLDHGQVVYENPSPGNKDGGLTTLEDKSLGCTQKGGLSPVTDVIGYGEKAQKPGLTLLSAPGNDMVASTALTVAGCQIILFTTGRGTPMGAPVPTVKIATNTALFERKNKWMDYDAGVIAKGLESDRAGEDFYKYIMAVASGRLTKNEEYDFREIGIFKNGVTL